MGMSRLAVGTRREGGPRSALGAHLRSSPTRIRFVPPRIYGYIYDECDYTLTGDTHRRACIKGQFDKGAGERSQHIARRSEPRRDLVLMRETNAYARECAVRNATSERRAQGEYFKYPTGKHQRKGRRSRLQLGNPDSPTSSHRNLQRAAELGTAGKRAMVPERGARATRAAATAATNACALRSVIATAVSATI